MNSGVCEDDTESKKKSIAGMSLNKNHLWFQKTLVLEFEKKWM